MKSILKKIIPTETRERLRETSVYKYIQLKKNYNKDMEKFKKYSFEFSKRKTRRHFESDLIFYSHKIEKGLSLPKPRAGFGKKNIDYLINALEQYVKRYEWDKVSAQALKSLYDYYYFNKSNNNNLTDLFEKMENIRSTKPDQIELLEGGAYQLTKADIDRSNFDFEDFANSRYSIRTFDNGEVSIDLIKKAVKIAQKTPSVCNRQSSRVYVYDDEMKNKVLKYQNGNAGFGEDASKILIVTQELMDFRGVIERNQCFIDGGMYAMTLIYALHSLGVGTCPLNLSITNDVEKKLKKVAGIGDSEVPIMMIAVGNLPDVLMVAASPRRDPEKVISIK